VQSLTAITQSCLRANVCAGNKTIQGHNMARTGPVWRAINDQSSNFGWKPVHSASPKKPNLELLAMANMRWLASMLMLL
jgi:hypothetical protein